MYVCMYVCYVHSSLCASLSQRTLDQTQDRPKPTIHILSSCSSMMMMTMTLSPTYTIIIIIYLPTYLLGRGPAILHTIVLPLLHYSGRRRSHSSSYLSGIDERSSLLLRQLLEHMSGTQ